MLGISDGPNPRRLHSKNCPSTEFEPEPVGHQSLPLRLPALNLNSTSGSVVACKRDCNVGNVPCSFKGPLCLGFLGLRGTDTKALRVPRYGFSRQGLWSTRLGGFEACALRGSPASAPPIIIMSGYAPGIQAGLQRLSFTCLLLASIYFPSPLPCPPTFVLIALPEPGAMACSGLGPGGTLQVHCHRTRGALFTHPRQQTHS